MGIDERLKSTPLGLDKSEWPKSLKERQAETTEKKKLTFEKNRKKTKKKKLKKKKKAKKKKRKKTRGRPRKKPYKKKETKPDDGRRKWKKLGYAKREQLKMLYYRERRKYGSQAELMDVLSERFMVSWATIYRLVRGDTYWDGGGDVTDSERLFKERVLRFLKTLGFTWYVKNDHRALRGIPDIIACINGTFVALELKGSREKLMSKANKSTKLQMFQLMKIDQSRGIAYFVYPGNWQTIKEKLKLIAKGDPDDKDKCRNHSQTHILNWCSEITGLLGFSPKTGVSRGESGDTGGTAPEGSADGVQQTGEQVGDEEREREDSGAERTGKF